MSWYFSISGKTSKLSEVIADRFKAVQGCPKDSEEETAKNILGEVAETLCKSFGVDTAVSIKASGSAWTENGKARSQVCQFEFITHGEFVDG